MRKIILSLLTVGCWLLCLIPFLPTQVLFAIIGWNLYKEWEGC